MKITTYTLKPNVNLSAIHNSLSGTHYLIRWDGTYFDISYYDAIEPEKLDLFLMTINGSIIEVNHD